ncbi:MAG: hypothetical protein ACT4OF_02325 [Caulobacteraceae bacterium]
MRRLLFALAFGLAACATPEAGADPIQADPAHLLRCVAAAAVDRAALAQCSGAVARPCIEAEGAGTHSDVLCWSEETVAWRALIDAATARIEAGDADKGARLRPANEVWDAWLEQECYYRAYEYGAGVGEQVDLVRCSAELTTARAIDLLTEP